jgi:transcriptional regulator with XRE-family HTH domain
VRRVYDQRVPADFAERLEDARKARGWSQALLANESGVSDGQISKYEGRKTQPDSETLKRLVQALELSSDYFLALDDRFSSSPGFRAAAHLTLDRYTTKANTSPGEEVLLKRIADHHEHPPVSTDEWTDLRRSLLLAQSLPKPTESRPNRTHSAPPSRRYPRSRPV